MIEFKALVHKKSGAVISYDEWINIGDNIVEIHFNYPVSIIEYSDIKFNTYTFKGTKLDMLVSDDFEIVYNNEFTYSEYWELMNISAEKGIMWLEEKAIKKINYIEKKDIKYGIKFD